jgi:hypothetical protein
VSGSAFVKTVLNTIQVLYTPGLTSTVFVNVSSVSGLFVVIDPVFPVFISSQCHSTLVISVKFSTVVVNVISPVALETTSNEVTLASGGVVIVTIFE